MNEQDYVVVDTEDFNGEAPTFKIGQFPVLRCPVCGYEYTHLREVYTVLGSDQHEAAVYPGTSIKGVSKAWRRDCLVLVFWCEGEHLFELRIQQNKGNTFVVARPATLATDKSRAT
jgi:hypothetical protein